jgi:hypothetical protein
MLKRLLHALVADPRVYNAVSFLFGSPIIKRRLRARAAEMLRTLPEGHGQPGEPLAR